MINPFIRLNRFKLLLAYFVAGVLSSAAPTTADVLYLRKSPDLGNVIAGLEAELAPAPIFENERGKFFYGKVLAYRPGTHARPPDDASFDHVLFLAHGRKGANPSRKPVEISLRDIGQLVHEYDAPSDFVFQFSNRHELLGVPFGAPSHRASLFRIFSPRDPRAMSGNSDAEISGSVREGTLTRFLISGPPSMDEMPMAGWSIHAPDYLFPGLFSGDNKGDRFAEMWPNGTRALLLAMARAREYPEFDQEVGGMAREAAGFMCSMALSDQGTSIAPELQIRARRAKLIGTGCFRDVVLALKVSSEYFGTRFASSRDGADIMPVSVSNYVLAAVDLLLSEPLFSRYIDPTPPLHDGVVYSTGGPHFRDDSIFIVQALADLAGGFSEAGQSSEVRQAAERALERMIAPGPNETAEERRENELSRRNFRAQIIGWADKYALSSEEVSDHPLNPRANSWLMGFYCRVGWGNRLDISAFARSRMGMAASYLRDTDRGAPDAELAALAERNIRQVGLMQRTALSGGREGLFLREMIENQIAEIRQSGRPENKKFIQIYDGYMGEELNCDGYQPEQR